jgi:hypothetical protein
MTARLRRVLEVVIVLSLALACAGPALAVSPQRIYKDLADNGKLDREYTRADITRAFNLERVVRTDQREPAQAEADATPAPRPVATGRGSDRRIPFTGLDLALLTVGGGPLLLIGIGLRRRLSPAAAPRGW